VDWQDSYSIGIQEVDAQHKRLLQLFSSVTDRAGGGSWSDLHLQVIALRDFARFHFGFEEALMRLFGFDESPAHALLHQEFFARLEDIERRALQGNVENEMVRFLCDWFTGHIRHCDRRYADFILSGAPVIKAS
jgi:hemerythrin